MKLILTIIGISIILVSCKKYRFKHEEYPTKVQSIDIDGNGTHDFEIKFQQISSKDTPISYSNIWAELRGLDSNRVLSDPSKSSFFLFKSDTIKKHPTTLQNWNKNNTTLISKVWNGKKWQKNWDTSMEKNATLKIGIYLRNNGLNKIGWIQFLIDEKTASISITSYQTTTTELLILD